MKYTLFLLLVLAIVAQGCKKNNDNPAPSSNTPQELLKTWKASKVLEGSTDVTVSFDAYRITFEEASDGSKNFTLINRQGTSQTGTWSLSTDGKTLTLEPSGGSKQTFSQVDIQANQLTYVAQEEGKTGLLDLSFTLVPA